MSRGRGRACPAGTCAPAEVRTTHRGTACFRASRHGSGTIYRRVLPGDRVEHAREPGEQQLGGDGEGRDEQRAGHHRGLVLGAEAEQDDVAEAAAGDERRDRRGGDDLHGGEPDPVQQQRDGQRQLDPAHDLQRAEPDAARGLDDVAVDLAHADVAVGEDRRDREQHQGGDRRGRAEAERADREQHEHGEGRDGAADVGEVDRERAAAARCGRATARAARRSRRRCPRAAAVRPRCSTTRVGTPPGPDQCSGSANQSTTSPTALTAASPRAPLPRA